MEPNITIADLRGGINPHLLFFIAAGSTAIFHITERCAKSYYVLCFGVCLFVCFSSYFYFHFSILKFVTQFTYHKVDGFKMYNSVVFSVFTMLCTDHYYLILEYFDHPSPPTKSHTY